MKRILERITYLVIGLLIASVAYLVGNADREVAAQDNVTRFDTIECSEIILKNGTNEIRLFFASDTGDPSISMARGEAPDKIDTRDKIDISILEDGPHIELGEGLNLGDLTANSGKTVRLHISKAHNRVSLDLNGGIRGGVVDLEAGRFETGDRFGYMIAARDRGNEEPEGVMVVVEEKKAGIFINREKVMTDSGRESKGE
ncbi:MAG: hypothetical protein OXH00_02430 [Candidatus Poribacteria bacterium]|nr:hypothetical protein [Candidatus Poribacteria bacterium]